MGWLLFAWSVVVISSVMLIERYGVPSPGQSVIYLLFGALFVLFGVMVGKMHEADVWSLLLLREWGINLSLMGIGYAAMAGGVVGLAAPLVRRIRRR